MCFKKISKKINFLVFYFLIYFYFFITKSLSIECYTPINNEVVINSECHIPAGSSVLTYYINKMYIDDSSFYSGTNGVTYDFQGAVGSFNDVQNAVLGVNWYNDKSNIIQNFIFTNLDNIVINISSKNENEGYFHSLYNVKIYSSETSKGTLNVNANSSFNRPINFFIDGSLIASPNGSESYGDFNLNLESTSLNPDYGTAYTLEVKGDSIVFLDNLNINIYSETPSSDLIYFNTSFSQLNINSINIFSKTMQNDIILINFFNGTKGVVNNILVSDESKATNTQITFNNVKDLSIGTIDIWGNFGNGIVNIKESTSLHVNIFDFTNAYDSSVNDSVSIDASSVLYIDEGIFLPIFEDNKKIFDVYGIIYLNDVLKSGYGYVGMNPGSKIYINGNVSDLKYIDIDKNVSLYIARDSLDQSLIPVKLSSSGFNNSVEYISDNPDNIYYINIKQLTEGASFDSLLLNNGIYNFSSNSDAKYKEISIYNSELKIDNGRFLEGTNLINLKDSSLYFINIQQNLNIPQINGSPSGISNIYIEDSGKNDIDGIVFNTHMDNIKDVYIKNSMVRFDSLYGENFFRINGKINISDNSIVNVYSINSLMQYASSIFISNSDLNFISNSSFSNYTITDIYGDTNTYGNNNVNILNLGEIDFNGTLNYINIDITDTLKTQFKNNVNNVETELTANQIGKNYTLEIFKSLNDSQILINEVVDTAFYKIYFKSGSSVLNSDIIIADNINKEHEVVIYIDSNGSVFNMDLDITNNSNVKQDINVNSNVNMSGNIKNMNINLGIQNLIFYLYDDSGFEDVDIFYGSNGKNLTLDLKNINKTFNLNNVNFIGNGFNSADLNSTIFISNDFNNQNNNDIKNMYMGSGVLIENFMEIYLHFVDLLFEGKINNVNNIKLDSSVLTYNSSENVNLYSLMLYGNRSKVINSKTAKIEIDDLFLVNNNFSMDSNVSINKNIDMSSSSIEIGVNKSKINSGVVIENRDASTIKFTSNYAFENGVSILSYNSKIIVGNFKITGLDSLNVSNMMRLGGSSKADQTGIIINTNYEATNGGYIQTNSYNLGKNSVINLVSSNGYDVNKKYLLIESGNGSGDENIDSGALIVIDDLNYYATYEIDSSGNVYAKIACVDSNSELCYEPKPPEPPIPPDVIPENSKVCDTEENVKKINDVILDGIESGNYDESFQHDMAYANADMDNINYSYYQMMPISNALRKNNLSNLVNQMKYVMNNRDFQTAQMYLNKYDGYYLYKKENNFEWFMNVGGYLGLAKNCIESRSNIRGENVVGGGEYKVLLNELNYFVFGVSFGYGQYKFLDNGLTDITTAMEVNQYEINGNVYAGAMYGEYDFFNNYLRIFSQYTIAVNNMDRFVNINTIAAINSSKSKDYNLLVSLEYGYNRDYITDNTGFYQYGYGGNGISFNPYLGLNFFKYNLSDYKETGNGFSLYVEGDEYTELLPYAGFRLKKNIFIGSNEKSYLMPILDFFVVFSNKSSIYYTTFNFNHIYGDTDITSLDDSLYSNNSLNVKFSLNYVINTNIYWGFNLSTSFSKNQNFINGELSFRYVL